MMKSRKCCTPVQRKYWIGVPRSTYACSSAFDEMSGVTKAGVLTMMKSCVVFSSSISLSPSTPITLMAQLTKPTSLMSFGMSGPGPEKRTQALYLRGAANTPLRSRSGMSSWTMNSARTMPCVLVLPPRSYSPGR